MPEWGNNYTRNVKARGRTFVPGRTVVFILKNVENSDKWVITYVPGGRNNYARHGKKEEECFVSRRSVAFQILKSMENSDKMTNKISELW